MKAQTRQFLRVDYSLEKLRDMKTETLLQLRNLIAENLGEQRLHAYSSHDAAVESAWIMLGKFEEVVKQEESMTEQTNAATAAPKTKTNAAPKIKEPAAPKAPKMTFLADTMVSMNVDANPKQAGRKPAQRFDEMMAVVKKGGDKARMDEILKTSYTDADAVWDFEHGYVLHNGKESPKAAEFKKAEAKPAKAEPAAAPAA